MSIIDEILQTLTQDAHPGYDCWRALDGGVQPILRPRLQLIGNKPHGNDKVRDVGCLHARRRA